MSLLLNTLSVLLALFLLLRLGRAASHRLLLLAGVSRYHSPLLYTTGLGPSRELHLGTAKDFAARRGACRRAVLADLAAGLIALCDDVEAGRLDPHVHFVGISDLLNDATARRLGFTSSRPGPLALMLALSAWLQVSLLRSVCRGAPARVRLRRLRRLRVRAGELHARRRELAELHGRLLVLAARPELALAELSAARP